MALYGELAFNFVEMGHHIDVVMNYEITAFVGYAIKKLERNKKMLSNNSNADSGWQTKGNRRKKVMTSGQLAQKARAQKGS